jgi:LmbE family N-acetylglucosaminyl deacetylase
MHIFGVEEMKYSLKTKRIILLTLLLLIISVCIISSFFVFSLDTFENKKYEKFPNFNKNDKLLIISPHPDDETIATGGLIQRAKEKNISIIVVCVTDGSASTNKSTYKKFLSEKNLKVNKTLPEMRNQELNEALHELGLNESNLIYLGYPDTGLSYMFKTNWDIPYNSKTYFNTFNQSPYDFSYQKNAQYTGKSLNNDLKNIINDFKPTMIVYPDSNDILLDHSTTNAFVNKAIIETKYNGSKYTYIVHKQDMHISLPFYFPLERMKSYFFLSNPDSKWVSLDINSNEIATKKIALDKYQSQLYENSNYLLSFLKSNELFIEYL